MFTVYILRSQKDGQLYTGFSPNLKSRLSKHRTGKVQATKARLPIDLLYYEAYVNEQDARNREKYFKSGWGRKYVRKILKNTLHVKK